MTRSRLSARVATATIAIVVGGCRVTNVEETRAARRHDEPRGRLVEDRAGTQVLKLVLLPFSMLMAGGAPVEYDPTRISARRYDRYATGGTDLERELFQDRFDEEIEAMLEAFRTKPPSPVGGVDK